MTSKSRYFLFGAAALLLIGLGGGLIAYFAYNRVTGLTAGLPTELKYVPADAELVAYADVQSIMKSELRRALDGAVKQGDDKKPGAVAIHDFAGIDVEKQVDHVVAYLEATGKPEPADRQPPRALVLVQGSFEQSRVEQFIQEHGGTIEDYSGKHIATRRFRERPEAQPQTGAPEPPVSHEEMAVGFVQPGVIALGQADLVRRTLDGAAAARATRNVSENAELMKLIRDASGDTAWVVGRFDAMSRRMGMPRSLTEQVPPLRLIAAKANINGGLKATITAETSDQAAADQLRDVVRGFVSLVRLQAGAQPELQDTLKTIELSGSGNTVQLSFAVKPQTVAAVIPQGPGRRNRPNPRQTPPEQPRQP
jgi:hypothetical protein